MPINKEIDPWFSALFQIPLCPLAAIGWCLCIYAAVTAAQTVQKNKFLLSEPSWILNKFQPAAWEPCFWPFQHLELSAPMLVSHAVKNGVFNWNRLLEPCPTCPQMFSGMGHLPHLCATCFSASSPPYRIFLPFILSGCTLFQCKTITLVLSQQTLIKKSVLMFLTSPL